MIRRLSAVFAILALTLLPALASAQIRSITPGVVLPTYSVGCIPKATSSTGLDCSLLSTDGTNLTMASGQFLAPDGTSGAPSYSFASDPDTGVYRFTTNTLAFGADSGLQWLLDSTGLYPYSNGSKSLGVASNRIKVGWFGGNNVTASTPGFDLAQTWNASGVSFIGATMAFTENASAAGSLYFQILGGASASTTEFYVGKGGVVYANGPVTANGILTASTGLVSSSSSSPASGAACTVGTISWDPSYIYVCTASGAWKRAALTGGY